VLSTIYEIITKGVARQSAASWLKKVGRTGSCNFLTDSLYRNFRQRRLRVLEILILRLNFPKIGGFQPQLLQLWTNIFGQKKFRHFSDSPKFRKGAVTPFPHPACHDATEDSTSLT